MREFPIRWLVGLLVGAFLLCGCKKERQLGPPRAVPVVADGVLRLRVMTFNLRHENGEDQGAKAWAERVAAVVKMICEERLDVFAVQEAMHGQVADVWASLSDYEFYGAGRADGKRQGEYTGFFYRRDRFEMDPTERGCFWLSDTPQIAGSITWGNQYPRMVAWARCRDRASGRSFLLYTTHWSHRHQASRMRAAELMSKHLAARRGVGQAVVLLGDFNVTSGHAALRTLMAGGGDGSLINAYDGMHPKANPRNTLHFWSGQKAGPLRVDHILANATAEVIEAKIRDDDAPLLSDHFPVVAELHFPVSGNSSESQNPVGGQ